MNRDGEHKNSFNVCVELLNYDVKFLWDKMLENIKVKDEGIY